MSDSNMIRALMRPLIQKAGGLMPAATIIDAALGLPLDRDGLSRRKSTLWQRQEGELEWPMVEVWALEDALGDRLAMQLHRSRLVAFWISSPRPAPRAATLSLPSPASSPAKDRASGP